MTRSSRKRWRALPRLGMAVTLGALLLAAGAFGGGSGDPARAQEGNGIGAVLRVCKLIDGQGRLDRPQAFEIKVGEHVFKPEISEAGPGGQQCELFKFAAPTKVLIAEPDTLGYQPSYTYEPVVSPASSPAPLPPDGIILYLYPSTCALEELKEWNKDQVDVACTVTIVNGRAALEGSFTLEKSAVQAVVNDPADVAFDVVLSSSYRTRTPDSLHVNFYDPGVTVISGPTAVKASCGTFPDDASLAAAFTAGLQSFALRNDECKSFTDDVDGLRISFRVAPAAPPVRTCEDQVITNTAQVHLLAETNPYSSVPGVDVKLSATASVTLKGDPALCPATIRVEKVESVVGFERPGAGWAFTLSGCGIDERHGVTGPDGAVVFADLPPAVGCSYTVSETPQPGWTAVTLSQSARPGGGETVTLRFVNIRAFDPPCVDPADPRCQPLELPPPPPAAPATPAPPAPIENPVPTVTPSPTAASTPAPTSTSGGVSTAPTPRPPATGTGPAGDGAAPLPLLALGALLALTTGTLLLAATPAGGR